MAIKTNECKLPKYEGSKKCLNLNRKPSKLSFDEKGIMYKDDKKFGKIIAINSDCIEVEVCNGNRYMEGQIIKFYHTKPIDQTPIPISNHVKTVDENTTLYQSKNKIDIK